MAAPWPFIERTMPSSISAFQASASFCLYLPLETGNAFFETSMERSQHRHLVFDISEFVLIKCEQLLFTGRQRVWERGGSSTSEYLFDLLGGKTKTQVHLNGLHAFDGLLIEVAIAIREPTSAQQPFLFIIAQGAYTHSCTAGYFTHTHEHLSFPECLLSV
jgi:hypothetical protein